MKERFCINCDARRPCNLKERRIVESNKLAEFVYTEQYLVCSVCGEEVYDPIVNDRNVVSWMFAFRDAYSEKVKENIYGCEEM